MDTEIRVSTESRPWRRKFSRRSSRDSNPRPFNHESGALTTELSPPPTLTKYVPPLCNHPGWLGIRIQLTVCLLFLLLLVFLMLLLVFLMLLLVFLMLLLVFLMLLLVFLMLLLVFLMLLLVFLMFLSSLFFSGWQSVQSALAYRKKTASQYYGQNSISKQPCLGAEM